MSKKYIKTGLPDEVVLSKIYLIRSQKVMLDKDLAELYDVETKQLKRAVRRNETRFPDDFMFELNKQEFDNLRSQFGTSSWGGIRYAPMAFTEHGVLQLANVVKSERAIQMSIKIIEVFVKMRKMFLTHQDLLIQMEEIRKNVAGQDEKIQRIFEYLNQFIRMQKNPRIPIGFKQNEK